VRRFDALLHAFQAPRRAFFPSHKLFLAAISARGRGRRWGDAWQGTAPRPRWTILLRRPAQAAAEDEKGPAGMTIR
jgi:hypothetical protein